MRKHEWKKMLSAVVAASMVFSLAPVSAGAASAQTEQNAVSEAGETAQSIQDVLDQGIKDTMNMFGVDAWYFPDAIDGVVDAGTVYLQGKGSGSSWTASTAGYNWEKKYPDKPVKTLIVKDATINNNSFYNMTELTKVKLEGVDTLGSGAFSGCSNLQQIDLGESLTDIGTSAFSNDISLTHIRIPAGVTQLKNNVFYGCTSLRDLAVCTTEAQPDMGDMSATSFASSKSLIYCSSGRGGMEHPFGNCSDMTIYVAERGNGIETAMDFTYKDFVGGSFTGNQTLASVTYSFSTLDQYEKKKEVTGELIVSCPDTYAGKTPEPKITKNETGIADANVKWMYFDKSKKVLSADTVTAKMGLRYVKAVLQDDTHFAYMSDYVPFQVQAPMTYTIEDGVLKIAPIDGVETMAMPDFDEPDYSASEVFAPWKDEEYTSIEIADGITSIGSYAFANASGLKKVVLGKNVTSIGTYAFGQSGLEEIDLSGSSVISIGGFAFKECKQLTRVKLSEKLETIGNYAFDSCGQLTSIKLPEKLKSLGGSAFQGCSSLKLVEGLENTELTEIPEYLFSKCSSLSNIQIPASVNKIGNYAFQQCTRLINVIYQTGAEGTVNLGSSAFYKCTSLENILLSGKNVTIGPRAFNDCNTLKKITIKEVTGEGDSILKISNKNAFENVTATIYVPNAAVQTVVREKLTEGAYQDDASKEEAEQKIKVITGGDDSDIAVKKFSSLSIALEEDAKEPGQTFAPSAVEKIGDGAVSYWYYRLENNQYVLVDPDNPAKVPSQMGTYFIEGRMAASDDYYACISNMVQCIIHGKVTDDNLDFDSKTGILKIKKDISNLDALKAVFSDYARRIKEVSWAESEDGYTSALNFDNCTALVKAENIPTTTSFQNCTSLTDITFAKNYSGAMGNFKGCTSLTEITIPDTVTTSSGVFDGCTALVKVENIRTTASFQNCTSLTDVTFAEDYSGKIGSEYTLGRGDNGFDGCTSLREITIPDAVTKLGNYAFKGCVSLEKVVIGKDSQLNTIGVGTFKGCVSLQSITILSSVTEIKSEAFQDCSALREINFLLKNDGTNSLREIGDHAFQNCSSLENIVIPKSVYESGGSASCDIGAGAFSGCSALKTVEMGTYGAISSGAFQDCTKLSSLKCYLFSSGEDARSYSINAAFANAGTESDSFVVTVSGTSNISANAFEKSGVTEIIVGDRHDYAPAKLNENALAGCSCLKSVTLQEMNYTAQSAPGIANGNFTARCPEDLVIYATGDTYNLLVDSGYTNAVDYKTVTAAKKEAFAASEAMYKGLDAALYDADALQAFLEDTLPLAKDLVEDATSAESTMNVFEQADIIDQAEIFLAEAYFGEGGLAEVPAAAVAALTEGLEETAYTAESWKALTDAQAAVATFLETQTVGATSAQVKEFENLVKAAKAVQLVEKTETPEPSGSPSATPSAAPSGSPSAAPSGSPSAVPSGSPSAAPSGSPSAAPSGSPSAAPSGNPSTAPSGNPSAAPSQAPGNGTNQKPGQNVQTPGQGTSAMQVKKPAAVKLSKVKAKKKSALIKWKKTAGAKGYQLAYGTKKNFKGAKKVSVKGSKTSYTIKKLKKGKTYYIRIRAYNTKDGKKQYGKWSAKKKIKIKK